LFAGPELLRFVYGGRRSDHQLHSGNDLSTCEKGRENKGEEEREGEGGRVRERRRERGRMGEEEEQGLRG
jgi:hypothetical protein